MATQAEHVANPTTSTGIQGKGIGRDKEKNQTDAWRAKKKAPWAIKKKKKT